MATRKPIRQAAALALRKGRLCLVTSSKGKHWVVPKGCFEKGKTAEQIALQEAWEEAGIVGTLKRRPVGAYRYQKAGNRYHVTVFLMRVTAVADKWPERKQRQRRWLPPAEAARRLRRPGLCELIDAVAAAV